MEVFLIAFLAIAVVAVILKLKGNPFSSNIHKDNPKRPNEALLPTVEKPNDKLVLVENVQQQELEKAIQQFCSLYNREDYVALPRLHVLSASSFAITFPFDTDIDTFAYFVNYLKYPEDIEYDAMVLGYTTLTAADGWLGERAAGKEAMLYLLEGDSEGDNVYVTTDDNISYKYGFGWRDQKQLKAVAVPFKESNESSINLSKADITNFR